MVHAAAIPGQTETESEPHLVLLLALLFGRVLGGYSYAPSQRANTLYSCEPISYGLFVLCPPASNHPELLGEVLRGLRHGGRVEVPAPRGLRGDGRGAVQAPGLHSHLIYRYIECQIPLDDNM